MNPRTNAPVPWLPGFLRHHISSEWDAAPLAFRGQRRALSKRRQAAMRKRKWSVRRHGIQDGLQLSASLICEGARTGREWLGLSWIGREIIQWTAVVELEPTIAHHAVRTILIEDPFSGHF